MAHYWTSSASVAYILPRPEDYAVGLSYERTEYGIWAEGDSRFIFVAPHGAGDDLNTPEIACSLARMLNAGVVINDTFVRPSNPSIRKFRPAFVEDFNRVPMDDNGDSLDWNSRVLPMKHFYDQIEIMAQLIRARGDVPVIVYVHGMRNRSTAGITLGFGAAFHEGELKGTRHHPLAKTNNGCIRANPRDILRLRDRISNRLALQHVENFDVCIGQAHQDDDSEPKFAAWSRTNAVQYFARYDVSEIVSFQLEISRALREVDQADATVALLARCLVETFPTRTRVYD